MDLVLAQFLILLAYVALSASLIKREESHILIFQIISCCFFASSFLLLGALTGLLINSLAIIRNFVYYKFEQENNIMLLLVFVLLGVIVTYNSFTSLFSVFPLISFVCYSFMLWKNNNKIFIYGNIITSSSWLVYNAYVSAYLGILGESIIIIVSLYIIIKKGLTIKS